MTENSPWPEFIKQFRDNEQKQSKKDTPVNRQEKDTCPICKNKIGQGCDGLCFY